MRPWRGREAEVVKNGNLPFSVPLLPLLVSVPTLLLHFLGLVSPTELLPQVSFCSGRKVTVL